MGGRKSGFGRGISRLLRKAGYKLISASDWVRREGVFVRAHDSGSATVIFYFDSYKTSHHLLQEEMADLLMKRGYDVEIRKSLELLSIYVTPKKEEKEC